MSKLVEQLVDRLRMHPLIKDVRLLNYDETPIGKLEVKLRCRLAKPFQLQIWLHHETTFQDYAYQLFTDRPLLRWDNAPHYPDRATPPHPFHNEQGEVLDSPLSGQLMTDLEVVLSAIETWLSAQNGHKFT